MNENLTFNNLWIFIEMFKKWSIKKIRLKLGKFNFSEWFAIGIDELWFNSNVYNKFYSYLFYYKLTYNIYLVKHSQ